MQVRVSHAAGHQPPREKEQQLNNNIKGLSPFAKSRQSPSFERFWRQKANANDREQKEKPTTRARSRAENRPDNNRPAPPRARPQAKTPTHETTPRQETDNLEISVQLSSRLFFEQEGNPKTPRLSQFTAVQNPSLKMSQLKFFLCDSTTVRRPLARIAL